MKRIAIVIAVLLAGAAAVAGTRARYGGELRVVMPALPESWDPAQVASPADLVAARLEFDTLLTQGSDGSLAPALAAAVPDAEASGRFFRLRLRPGLRFHDGTPLTAQDLAASLGRLADPANASPYSALVLPLVGASTSGPKIAGLVASGELEVQASLAFAYPDWPRALAHPAAGVAAVRGPNRLVGTGPFSVAAAGPMQARLVAFADCPLGRPFADSLVLSVGDARSASRTLALGEADLTTVPLPDKAGAEGPALFASYLVLNPSKLGPRAEALRQAFDAAVDVADLTRFFVRGPAVPMYGLLPPALNPSSSTPRVRGQRPNLPSGMQLTLVVEAGEENHRAVGERLQVKLHDFGVQLQVQRLARPDLRRALASGSYDLALVSVLAVPEPGMALAQLVTLAQSRDAAREELRIIGGPADPAARRALAANRAEQLLLRLPLIPLYAQAPRVAARAGVAPVGFDGSGAPNVADAWLLEPRRGRVP